MPLTCGIASFSPSLRSLLVSEKDAAGGRLSYGFQLIWTSPSWEGDAIAPYAAGDETLQKVRHGLHPNPGILRVAFLLCSSCCWWRSRVGAAKTRVRGRQWTLRTPDAREADRSGW